VCACMRSALLYSKLAFTYMPNNAELFPRKTWSASVIQLSSIAVTDAISDNSVEGLS
jgi:hypothetical protein